MSTPTARSGAPSVRRRRRATGPLTKRNLSLAAILLVGVAYATLIQSFSWNQTSHYDLIRSLDRDRTTIDQYQENTGDKAFYKGHWYSARAPGVALFALPFYDGLKAVGAERVARSSKAQRGEDEMIYFIGLWVNVLPGLLLLLLVGHLAERLQPGYGAATAVILGLGTLALPLSTLLFSHIFTAFLGFAAFALMLHERDGPPNPWLLGLAGLCVGYAGASEYPLFFVAVVLGLYLLSRSDSLTPRRLLGRVGAYVLGGLVGIVPLLLYNHYAFHSWTHLAYSNIPRQQKGFFGIGLPSLKVMATLLFDSRGLLTISPVLAMGAVGTWLLYKRGKRAEALTIAGICVCYLGYNSGYYLPFGGGFMGPRFLTTMLPFLALPIGIALKRYPGPTIALAGTSLTTTIVATITHPLTGYETEAVVWARYLREGFFQPTIASAFGLGRGWGGIWPFLLAVGGAVLLATLATARTRISRASLVAGVLALAGWCVFAALAPTVLGIDHRGLLSIVGAGDDTALHKGFGDYPLRALAPLAAALGLVGILIAYWLSRDSSRREAAYTQSRSPVAG
jgi:xanthosine utilization system XapX-like protein